MKRILAALLITASCLISATSVRAQVVQDADSLYATSLLPLGTEAPAFEMKNINGETWTSSSLKGQWAVLDFWASWCPDCLKDAPRMAELFREFSPRGVQFVGISMDTDPKAWAAAVEKHGLAYTHVSELKRFKETEISKTYGIHWIPSMYLINPEGKVELATVLIDKMGKRLAELFPDPTPMDATSQELELQGSKGKLAATLVTPLGLKEGEKLPLTILMHGFTGNRNETMFRLMADSLAKHGIASLRFDFNGHGQSEGLFQEMTVPNEIDDAHAVIAYCRQLPWVDKIAIVGHSQGGVVASMTAGLLTADSISATVLLAPASVMRDDVIRGNTFGAFYDPRNPPEVIQLGNYKLGANYIRTAFHLPIFPTAAKYQGPALILHGNADRLVPFTCGEHYHEIWPNSQFVEMEGYGHGFEQNIYRAVKLTTQFLGKTLKP